MNWLIRILEGGRLLPELSARLKIPETELLGWKNGMPKTASYTEFQILKKNGKDYRSLSAPDPNLKNIQKSVYYVLLKPLKSHESAVGFVYGKSIVHNAKKHVGAQVVINLDLKDFFGSTNSTRVYQFYKRLGWGKTCARILTNICCYRDSLPQGAVTSPYLSNLLNYKMDTRLNNLCKKFGGSYSRYADDLSFSFKKYTTSNKQMLPIVKKILHEYGYIVQKRKKIRILRSHQRQTVTGLVVNNKVNLPREIRRKIRAMEHHRKMGKMASEKLEKLSGYQSLSKMIEKQRE